MILCGDLTPLLSLTNKQVLRLRKISSVQAALLGPTAAIHDDRVGQQGHFDNQMRVLQRVSGPKKGVYGIIKNAAEMALYHRQEFLFPLSFRLSGTGGLLSQMEASAHTRGVLPICLGGEEHVSFSENWKYIAPHEKPRYNLDKQGSFAACNYKEQCHVASRCVGIAEGWDPTGIKPQRNSQ